MYICKKMRVCTYLLKRGFQYVKTEPRKENPKHIVWLFPMTPELKMAVEDYYEELDRILTAKENGNGQIKDK